MSSTIKKKIPFFAWASAISVGGVFSFVIFLLGSESFDHLMVDLGIRTAVSSDLSEGFQIGDTYISVTVYTVLGLGEKGVPFNAVQRTTYENKSYAYHSLGSIKHPKNMSVDDGTITTASIIPEKLAKSIFLETCVTTARYKFGIPFYNYDIFSVTNPQNKIPLLDQMRLFPRYVLAESLAKKHGETNFSEVQILPESITELLQSGTTFNWNYCIEEWDGNKIEAEEIISVDSM